jgi:nucleoid-associated protein YgaU
MLRGKIRLFLAVLLAGLAVASASGCSKFDGLERNMQYVSDELLRKDADVAWRLVNEAHAAWIKAGASHEKDNSDFIVYQDAYGHYAVIYNELWDRQGNPFGGRLHSATDILPPPPPGVNLPPAAPKAAASPADDGPAGRDLGDTSAAAPAAKTPARQPAPAKSAPAPAPAPAKPAAPAATRPAGPGSYLIQPGDTLSSIAKRHGLSEKRLMEANGLTDPRKIAAGKQLTIPAP